MITAFVTNRYVLAVVAVTLIIGGGVWWMKSYNDAIRATVVAEYQLKIDQLEADVAQAEANIVFERSQAAKNAQASAAYSAERVAIYRQVQAADNAIQQEIAEGTLANPAISPVKASTIDAIEELERQRAASEAR